LQSWHRVWIIGGHYKATVDFQRVPHTTRRREVASTLDAATAGSISEETLERTRGTSSKLNANDRTHPFTIAPNNRRHLSASGSIHRLTVIGGVQSSAAAALCARFMIHTG
jgi:hypothetical protein